MKIKEIKADTATKKDIKLKPIKEPRKIQLEYYRELKKLTKELKEAVNKELLPALKGTSITKDSVVSVLGIMESIRRRFSNIEGFSSSVSNDIVNAVNNNGKQRLLNSVNANMGVDITNVLNEQGLNEIVALQRQKNKVLIKSIPEEFLKSVEVVITNGIANGESYKEMERQLKGVKNISSTFGKLDNRIKMIVRNETSSINASINKARYEQLGINLYQWETSQDERVRADHDVMQGKYCTFDDATVYADTLEDAKAGEWKKRSSIGGVEKHPGIDFNCRCVSLPIID